MKWWLYQVLIALDQFVNAVFAGWADETLSSRAYRTERDGKLWGRIWRPIIDVLFIWQVSDHCRRAYIKERERIHVPPEMRTP